MVRPWCTGELAIVCIFMTIDTESIGKLELGLRSCGNMAGGTFDFGVRRHKRKSGFGMVRYREGGWLPALYRVAAFTAAAIGAFGKLSVMRVRLMAVSALGVSNRKFEISAFMTGDAVNLQMPAQEWKACTRVIETGDEGRFLPRGGGVAGGAVLLELSFMGVGVTCGAGRKWNSGKARPSIEAGNMALLADDLPMEAGERKARFGMIEAVFFHLGIFPILSGMALGTVRAKATLMLVFMTGDALGQQAKEGVVEVFPL